MPWHTSGRYAFSPINATSKKPYRGINTVCLWAAAQAKGYERGEWATYQQWQDKGAQVRKGEKATLVVFWKFANDSSEITKMAGNQPVIAPAVHSRIFASSMPPRWTDTRLRLTRTCRCRNVSPMLRRSFARLARTFGTAETKPSMRLRRTTSRCRRSPRSRKTCPTIRPSPMNIRTGPHQRPGVIASLGKRFGDNAYAAEELIAELGAAFTCAHLGLSTEPREDHAQYLAQWLRFSRRTPKRSLPPPAKHNRQRIG